MTTTDHKVLHSRFGAQERAIRGYQAPLIIVEAPSGATAQATLGKALAGLTLTVDGDYVCLIPLGGLAGSLKVHLKAQLTSMTATSAGPDELMDFNPRVTNVADAVVLSSGTGDGSLTHDTDQTSTLTLTGALYARVVISIAGSPTSVVFTYAEAVGL